MYHISRFKLKIIYKRNKIFHDYKNHKPRSRKRSVFRIKIMRNRNYFLPPLSICSNISQDGKRCEAAILSSGKLILNCFNELPRIILVQLVLLPFRREKYFVDFRKLFVIIIHMEVTNFIPEYNILIYWFGKVWKIFLKNIS